MIQDRRVAAAAPLSATRGLLRTFAPLKGTILFARRKPLGAVGGMILIALSLIAILAPAISPYQPTKTHADDVYATPGAKYLLGADEAGRDVLSRLFYGARVSLYVALVTAGIGITLGALLGIISAYIGGKFDLIIQRFVDAFLAFPGIILALGIMAVLGASVNNVILALLFVVTPGTSRTVRAQALVIKELDYITAARAVGCSPVRIILRHMMPNCLAIYVILTTIQLGLIITTEASLSFLGVGVPLDVPSWGGMLNVAARAFVGVAPWLAIFPGITIALAVFGANLLGDALRDVLDPRLRSG